MADTDLLSRMRTLLEQEQQAARAQFEAMRAGLDAEGREAAGIAVGGLVVADTGAGALGRTSWALQPKSGEELAPVVSTGDPVRVYRRRAPEEAMRALVSRRTRRGLTVVFDEPPPESLEQGELVVERESDERSHARLVSALNALASADRGRTADWRAMVLGERAPGAVGDAAPLEDERLNARQQEAAGRALAAPDAYLVHGPPGTGKTEVLAAIGAAEVERGGTVLACAASNAAVDNLVARLAAHGLEPVRLGHPARVHEAQIERTLEARAAKHEKARIAKNLSDEAQKLLRRADRAVRQGRAADRFAEARLARAEAKRLLAEARTLAREAEDEVLERARLVCATLTGLGSKRLGVRRFDLALIDEATQATLPATMLALLRTSRAVLAGDQHQLPPTVISLEASRGGLSRTLYERWLDAHGEGLSTMLSVQHRMHASIMRFPNESLYDGGLVAHPSVAGHLLRDLEGVDEREETSSPLLFVDTAGKGWSEERPEGSESVRNEGEARRMVREVRRLREAGVRAEDIGVIAPYAAQVQLLRSLLPEEALEIDTVDAFQGREKEAVCVSLTRSNDDGDIGFCADVRRMNVALTRARRRLFVVGDSATLGGHPFYASFVARMQDMQTYRSAWEEEDD